MNRRLLGIACSVALACSRTAVAADTTDLTSLDLEQLMEMNIGQVYGASKYRQRVTQAPSSISIVTAEDIRRFGYRTMSDVLSGVRGLYVSNDRNYENLGVRGFMRPGDFTTRVLVLIDGHRLNDAVYDSGAIGREAMLDVELIERVEVIRGPSSSVYGSSAFLGVINIVTKHGSDFGGSEASLEGGSLDTYKVRGTAAGSTQNGLDWTVSASDYTSAGDRHIYYSEFDPRASDEPLAAHNGVASHLDDERAKKFFSSLHYGGFSAQAYYSNREKQVPTASYGTIFGDPAERTDDVASYLELSYKQAVSEHADLQWRGFFDRFTYEGTYPTDYAAAGDPPDRVLYRDQMLAEWAGTETQLTVRPSERYTFVGGVEYRYNLHQNQRGFDDVDPRVYYVDNTHSGDILGLYAQAEARLRPDISITAGLRHDRYGSDIGSTTNPRVALIYNPSPASAVKALYGRAFRAPNPYEHYYFAAEQANHPALEPETIDTYELVYEHYFGTTYRMSLSTYTYDIKRLITQTSRPAQVIGETPIYYFANIESVRARGVEVEWEGSFENGTLVRGSFSAQRAKEISSDQELTNSPRRMAKLSAISPVFGSELFAGLELQYMSKALTLARTHAPSVVLTNLTLNTHDLWHGVELTAGIYNVFDKEHWVPGGGEHLQPMLKQDGRTYMGKVVVRF